MENMDYVYLSIRVTKIPLQKRECPTGKSKLNVQDCEKSSYGELCEGVKE